jgi:hypothetical protein
MSLLSAQSILLTPENSVYPLVDFKDTDFGSVATAHPQVQGGLQGSFKERFGQRSLHRSSESRTAAHLAFHCRLFDFAGQLFCSSLSNVKRLSRDSKLQCTNDVTALEMHGHATLGITMIMARKESIWATCWNLISGITGKSIRSKAKPTNDSQISPRRTKYSDHTLHVFEGSFGDDDTKHNTDVDA